MNSLKEAFNKKGLTLGSVESFTGGLFASSVVSLSGASTFFKGALVTYYTEEKVRLLGIDQSLVDSFGVVSKEISEEMAKKGIEKLGVDVCISFTGNAGPDAMEGKPVGKVFMSIATKNKVVTFENLLKGTRKEIREEAISLANEYLLKEISTF